MRFTSFLERRFKRIVPEYDMFENCVITKDQWEKSLLAADGESGEERLTMAEIDKWAKGEYSGRQIALPLSAFERRRRGEELRSPPFRYFAVWRTT